MDKRQRLFVSIIAITLILLTLLGITYAYYLTRIQGNTNTNSISIRTAKLELLYGDGNEEIEYVAIMPGDDMEAKTFTVKNNGNTIVNEYAVALEEVVNTLTRTSDLTYTLTCVQKNPEGIETGTCNGTSGVFPNTNSLIVTNSIEVGYIHEYSLKVVYANLLDTNQSIDMGSTIKAKVQIFGLADTIDLAGTIHNAEDGDYVQINSETKTSKIVNGTYKLVGIKPGIHTLKVCGVKDETCSKETAKVYKTIVINKGAKSGKGTTTVNDETVPLITITNDSQLATIDIIIDEKNIDIDETISNYNPYKDGTLAYNIYKNKALVEEYNESGESIGTKTNNIVKSLPYITGVSDGRNIEDSGLFMAADDYGTSYYFRGTVRNNYVNFAGFTWRIVRINGDGSIRLILDGTLDKICVDYNDDNSCNKYAGTTSKFNTNNTDNAYIGYTYGTFTTNSRSYDEAHKYTGNKTNTIGQSDIKQYVDKFYENYLKNNYNDYISDTLFCQDKSLSSNINKIGNIESQAGYGTNNTYYAVSERLYFSDNTNKIIKASPTLKCISNNTTLTEEQKAYSRYTVNGLNINNIKTNNNLTYPIALLSADELVLAGAWGGNTENNSESYNTKYYLHNSNTTSTYWWTMTPYSFVDSNTNISTSYLSNTSLYTNNGNVDNGVRPVINLVSNILLDGTGDGTENNPYKVKLSS